MIEPLKLAALPIAIVGMLFGGLPIASAASVHAVVTEPHVTSVATRHAATSLAELACVTCTTPSITASMPGETLFVHGDHFNPGDQVEVLILTGFFGEDRLLDTVVTVASDSHCRASRDCPGAPGTFEVVHDFSAEFQAGMQCGESLDVGAIDLAPLQAGLPAPAINAQFTVCQPPVQQVFTSTPRLPLGELAQASR